MNDLPTAQNGTFTSVDQPPYSEGNRATLNCNQGYTPQGVTESVLELTGTGLKWNPPSATCVPFLDTLPDAVNGTFSSTAKSPFIEGHKATLTCNAGYVAIGPTESVLESSAVNGLLKWNPASGLCTLPIPDLPRVSNGRFESNSVAPFQLDDEATLNCDAGYEPNHVTIKVVLDGNQLKWDPATASCNPVVCPDPPMIDHGIIDGHSFTYPNQIEYSCEVGYILTGHATGIFQCSEKGTWQDDIPQDLLCTPVTCPPLYAPLNGQMQCPSRDYNETAVFTCDAGYKLENASNGTRVCLADGTWSGDDAKCVPLVPCELTPEIKKYNIKTITPSTIILDCGNGREHTILCENLKWLKDPPYCEYDSLQIQGGGGGGGVTVHVQPVDPNANKNTNVTYRLAAGSATAPNNSSGTTSKNPTSTSGATAATAGKPVAASSFSYGYWIVVIIIAIVTSVLVWFGTRFWLRNRTRLGTVKI